MRSDGSSYSTPNSPAALTNDTNQAQWYTGNQNQSITLNISIVFTGNTISYYMNGNLLTTRLGSSVSCIRSSAPYYAAVRMLGNIDPADTISMNILPAQGPTGVFTPTNLTLVSKAPTSILNMGNANSISVVKSGSVILSDNPFVFSANPLTGPFVLNFLFNTDAGASQTSTDGSQPGDAHAVEFAVGLVNSITARNAFNGRSGSTMLYGMMVNTPTLATNAAVYYKTDSGTALSSLPVIVPATGAAPSPVNSIQMTNTATQSISKGGSHSLQIKYDGANLTYYVDGSIIAPAGQAYTFSPSQSGPYYLVMSFANSDQYSSIPSGQTVPPTNFILQATMSELFGATGLLGTTLTHLQTFMTTQALTATTGEPLATNATYVSFTIADPTASVSSSTPAEITYANGIFTYTARDNSSRAMVNLTINISAGGTFNMRYLVFTPSSTVPKVKGPTIPASGSGTTWGLSMKTSFILNSGDTFLLQGWAAAATSFAQGSLVIVEKLPVAQGGGGQRWVNIQPIPKRHPSRKSSLRISKSSTKKTNRK
jgi:hypothetical protein